MCLEPSDQQGGACQPSCVQQLPFGVSLLTSTHGMNPWGLCLQEVFAVDGAVLALAGVVFALSVSVECSAERSQQVAQVEISQTWEPLPGHAAVEVFCLTGVSSWEPDSAPGFSRRHCLVLFGLVLPGESPETPTLWVLAVL